jgi:ADP-ribosylglycohydrolase
VAQKGLNAVTSAAQEAAEWVAGEGSLLESGRRWVREVLQQRDMGSVEGVQHFGRGPKAVSVLQSSLHLALTAGSYVEGVRNNILAGGDTTSRCVCKSFCAAVISETSQALLKDFLASMVNVLCC